MVHVIIMVFVLSLTRVFMEKLVCRGPCRVRSPCDSLRLEFVDVQRFFRASNPPVQCLNSKQKWGGKCWVVSRELKTEGFVNFAWSLSWWKSDSRFFRGFSGRDMTRQMIHRCVVFLISVAWKQVCLRYKPCLQAYKFTVVYCSLYYPTSGQPQHLRSISAYWNLMKFVPLFG